MRAFLTMLVVAAVHLGCTSPEEDIYTANTLEYDLFQGTELFDYNGKAIVRELKSGELEVTLRLDGQVSNDSYMLQSHLHFGPYDQPDAALAYLLNPIDLRQLESKTILGPLSDGENLSFEKLRNFDGHIKVHLAPDGPDYETILVVGNIGRNGNDEAAFNRQAITVCSPYGLSRVR